MDVVIGHINADFDSVGSAVGAGRLYPGAALVLPGGALPGAREFLALHREILPFRSVAEIDPAAVARVIVVDACSRSRLGPAAAWLDRPEVEVHLYDHHPEAGCDIRASFRRVEAWGAAASVVATELRARGLAPDPAEATALLLGIYEDTGSLAHPGTTPADLEAAAWLLRCGAHLDMVARFLHRTLTPEQRRLLQSLLAASEIVSLGGVAVSFATAPPGPYVEDAAALAGRLLEIQETDAAFLLAPMDGQLHVIARSRSGALDVGAVLRELGGGGHPRAASALLRDADAAAVRQRLLESARRHVAPEPTAREIMSWPVRAVRPDDPIAEAGQRMVRYGHSGLAVLEGERLVGIVTRRDVDRARHHRLEHAPVRSIMTTEVRTVSPDTPLSELERLMTAEGVGRLLVVQDGDVVGIVTRTDVLRARHGASYLARSPRPEEPEAARLIRERLPARVQRVLEAIGRAAARERAEAYVVGGFVRDLFLGVRNLDLDIVVEPDGIALARAVAQELGGEVVRVDPAFGTAKVRLPDGLAVDFATARTEAYARPGALPEVEPSSIVDDLRRRDFTLNAMAIALRPERAGQLLDPFGGREDLARRRLRVLHNLSFIEDPTRIFRAARFEARFHFRMDPDTEALAREAIRLGTLGRISPERLRAELFRTFREPQALAALRRLAELGVLDWLAPGLVLDAELFAVLPQALQWWGEKAGTAVDVSFVYLAALLAPLGLAAALETARTRLRLAPAELRRLEATLRALQTVDELAPPAPPSVVARALRTLPDEALPLLRARALAAGRRDLAERLDRYVSEWRHVRLEIDGEDLKRLGYPPGPALGEALRRTLDAKLDGEVAGREAELAFARSFLERCSPEGASVRARD